MSVTASEFGGRLQVQLDVSAGRVSGVNIHSTRPEHAAQVFIGRTPHDVVGTLGLIFSLCGRAQSICGLAAVEQAQAQLVTSGHVIARDILRQAEMLSQTAMRVCLDWPRLLGLDSQPGLARNCLAGEAQLERALFGDTAWKVPGGVSMNPDSAAVRAVLEPLQKAVRGETLGTHLKDALDDLNLNGFGGQGDREDGALRRRIKTPGVQGAIKSYGAGLRARLEARLEDLSRLPDEMILSAEGLCAAGPSITQPGKDGQGQACVETARGPLTHHVILQDGLIKAYDIVAPTDANFAIHGPVVSGLMGADASNVAALMRAAELHVMAIDPCVDCTVEVSHA